MPEPTQLDESPHSLTPDELAFYQKWTGITDETELRQHILEVQAQAYKIFPYPCIQRFSFIKLRLSHHPSYKHVLEYVQTHPDAIYLELACCFGNEARKVMFDGYPPQNIITTDLRQDYWNLGFELFKDDSSKFPVSFIQGDIFSSKFFNTSAEKLDTRPDLSKVKSLTELLGHVSAIRASAFFHLFSEEDQLKVARGCASLLTGLPGVTVFGAHIGAPKSGLY
ncbi:hypothetical protein FS749_016786 [Ceratobasidium sp. UAMH 11750]|nr:hypothetical protein FS749_016786 [Ceratobasidium sp. UAMH 11750]